MFVNFKKFGSVLALAALVSLSMPATPAFADAACSSPSGAPESSMVICTNNGTVVSRAPLSTEGTYAQEIVTTIDPSRTPLSSTDQIVAPAGWLVSYFDGSTWSDVAPTTPSGWASITKVKASGDLTSLGLNGSNQIAGRNLTAPLAESAPFSAGDAGDGWSVFFDDSDHVFNIFHHDGATQTDPAVDCHTRTGNSCGPGWPFALAPFHSNYQSEGWIDNANDHLWFETNNSSGTGFACVDISDYSVGPQWCGGSDATAFVQSGSAGGSAYGQTGGLANIGSRIFTWESDTGHLMCADVSLNGGLGGTCPDQPVVFGGLTSAPFQGGQSLVAYDGKIYGAGSTTGICVDAATLAVCSGWPISLSNPGFGVFPLPDSSGAIQAICFIDTVDTGTASNGNVGSNAALLSDPSTNPCFTLGGASTPRPSSLLLATSNSYDGYGKNPDVTGTRVYWASSWVSDDHYYCWDASLNAGAGGACPNWPIVDWPTYTIQVDPQNDNCLWSNADSGGVKTWDAIRATSGCVTPPSTVRFDPALIVPRMSCGTSEPIVAWNEFALSDPTDTTYNSAALTVRTADGTPISGWSDIALTGSRVVDLSLLDVATSGQNPIFDVIFDWNESGPPTTPVASVSASGGAPELCITPFTVSDCSSDGSSSPANSSGVAEVTAEGTSTVGGSSQDFVAATTSIDLAALYAATCAPTLPNTGLADGTPWFAGAIGVLIAGMGLVLVRRRTE